jgi:ribose-phosphate pyrophosphokinase
LLPPDSVVVSPDLGRLRTATEVARLLGLPAAVLHKHRESGSEVHVTKVVGDVRGRSCLIIDDMIVTGGTIAEGVKALLRAGARAEVIVAATHGPLLDAARERMSDAAIVRVLVTDTIVPGVSDWPKLRLVSVAPVIARAIRELVA